LNPNSHEDFKNVLIRSFNTITSTYTHEAPAIGNYDVAYDIWINGVATSGTTELMIWTQALGKQADAIKSYPSMGTVTLSGITYNVQLTTNLSENGFILDNQKVVGTARVDLSIPK